MKHRGMALAVAAAALGAMPATFGLTLPQGSNPSVSTPGSSQGNRAVQPSTGQTAAARRMFTAGGTGDSWGGYRRGPKRKVAWDKRDARRARNRARSRR